MSKGPPFGGPSLFGLCPTHQSIGLKLSEAPSLMPLGQREVIVLVRV
jgi:hypothetical protein